MIRGILTTLVAITLSVTLVYASPKTVETFTSTGEGDVEIVRSDYIDARISAKNMATQQALWKVIGQLLSAQEMSERFDHIQSAIAAKSADFVQKYKFAEETISPDNKTYHVALEVVFFADQVRGALENLGTAVAQRKRVVIVIDERAMDGASDTNFLMTGSMTEDRLRQAAGDAGYKGMARAEVRALGNDPQAVKAVEGDADAVRWMATQLKADYVITGTARATAGTGMLGTIRLNVYAADGSPVWSKEITESAPGGGGPERFRVIRLCADKAAVMVSELLATRK
ncbi:MAG: DUF2066 domain-containing protein [Nitrospinae bacterium]|nr:DUF2066 domain-containing protein [Nitrospinota bacterium]